MRLKKYMKDLKKNFLKKTKNLSDDQADDILVEMTEKLYNRPINELLKMAENTYDVLDKESCETSIKDCLIDIISEALMEYYSRKILNLMKKR